MAMINKNATISTVKKKNYNITNEFNLLEEGTKVKLNLDNIMDKSNWDYMREDYKEWVKANKEKIFTVEYDNTVIQDSHAKKILVCLKEDDSFPKRLFFTSDLIILNK